MRFTFSSLSFKIMSYDTAAINDAALKELLSMTVKKLTSKQKILVAGTLFGMFFGAGNLIFPVHLGQMAGSNVIPAIIGFIITAVGMGAALEFGLALVEHLCGREKAAALKRSVLAP